MTTTLKNREIIEGAAALARLSTLRLPVKAGYAITKTLKSFESVGKAIEEYRLKLIREHAELDDEGEPKIEGDRFVMRDDDAFAKAYAELLEEESEVSVHQAPLDAFGGAEIEAQLIGAAHFMFDEPG